MDNNARDSQNEFEESESSPLAKVSDLAFDLLTGTSLPAPIRRNFFKVFGQLCTAAIDVPVAYLEGKADEMRAGTKERIKIIATGGNQIAEQMNVEPEYAKAAVKKYGEKILRERINLDKTCKVAAEQIQADLKQLESEKKSSSKSETEDEITSENAVSDDWLNTFENEAASKSTEEMQSLFGRILAGEIQKPQSFSIKTLKLIGQLDSEVAKAFRRLCSLTATMELPPGVIHDARVISTKGNAGQNSLIQYELGFSTLNVLEEYGLIISDYNSYMGYDACIATSDNRVTAVMGFQNKKWGFVRKNNSNPELKLHGVQLSHTGKELLEIVDIEPHSAYMLELLLHFEGLGLQMVEIK